MRNIRNFRQFVLLLGDLASCFAALFIALGLRYGFDSLTIQWQTHRAPFVLLFIIWFVIFYVGGLYNLRAASNIRRFFSLFLWLFGINAAVAVAFFYLIPYFAVTPKTVLFLDLFFTIVLLALWRFIFNRIAASPPQKIAMIGLGKEVDELLHDIQKHPHQGYECVVHLTKIPDNFVEKMENLEVDFIVVAVDYRNDTTLQHNLFACIPLRIQIVSFVDFYEQYFQKVPHAVIDQAWFLENLNESAKRGFSFVKRGIDIALSLGLGVIGVVLAPFVALMIVLDSGRPVFYSQLRVGAFARIFRIYKFRSMRSDESGQVTAVGRFLRATHLDEIPQLWNVIRGEMSFVGPRPEQPHFVEDLKKQIPFYAERLLVAPGITGWAQLHEPRAKAEDAMSKLQYDLFYIKHRSLLLDLEIILKTLRVIIL